MPRSLSPNSSVDVLRGEAKRWLKSVIRGDLEAVARFGRAFPNHTGVPKLREVQHALAREHGFSSWAMLKQEIQERAGTFEDRVRLFPEKSANPYGNGPLTQKWGDYER